MIETRYPVVPINEMGRNGNPNQVVEVNSRGALDLAIREAISQGYEITRTLTDPRDPEYFHLLIHKSGVRQNA